VHLLGPTTGPPPVDHRPVTALALKGQLCQYTVGQIRELVLDLAADSMMIVLDLHDLEFLDAAGLRLLLEVDGELARHDGRLVLERVGPLARRVMAICDLEHLLLASR